jgi:internalin A
MKDIDVLRKLATLLKRDYKYIVTGDEHHFTYQTNKRKNVIALHLNHFGFKNIPDEVFQLQHLKCLDISHNLVDCIPEKINILANLEELWFQDNELQELPEYILQNTKLKQIYCRNNPLIRPPLFGNSNALDEHKKIYKIINEAKVIVLGEGDVGKTCLTERILNGTFDEQKRTKGISIKKWKTSHNDNDLSLNFWDFGGQEIYHSTHQFFLTKRSLYVLVWNARKSKDYEHIYRWLNIIDAYSKNSPILIVMSKKSEMNDNINMDDITKRYPQVKEHFKVDSKNGEGIEELKRGIRLYSWDLPIMRTPWIKSWFNIRDQIEKFDRNWISFAEFREICRKNKVEEDEYIKMDEYLHDIGHIIHFHGDLKLSTMVILKPEWATKAVYNVLDHAEIIENNGILLNKWLSTIWEEKHYPIDVHNRLLCLMNKFELSYELIGKECHLVAELLPLIVPDFEWNPDRGLMLFYTYDFLPSGILTRFIVLIHDYIIRDKENFPICWKEGVLIRHNNTKSLIKLNTPERRIEINIQGENSRDLLSIITCFLDKINKEIKKVKFAKKIPCNCSQDCDKFWDFNNLKRLERKGIPDIRCDESGLVIKIDRLLNYYELQEDRFGKLVGTDNNDKMIINVNQNSVQNVSLKIEFEINVELPELQTALYKLEEETSKESNELGIGKLVETFDRLGAGLKNERFIAPFNKLRRFLDNANNPDTDLHKILIATKNGIDTTKKICRIYNKFAQWLILPQVPGILVKK